MLRASPSPSAVRVALVAASTLLAAGPGPGFGFGAAAAEASADARLALGEEDWVFDDGFRFREKGSVRSGGTTGARSESESEKMERVLAGGCERPKVTCEPNFDKQGMRCVSVCVF